GDGRSGLAKMRRGERRREARSRKLADGVEAPVECDETALVGVGGPRKRREAEPGGRRAAEKEEGEAAGRRRATAEHGCREHGAQGAHQVAGETVLISIVCSPLTIRCMPVTFTLPSAYCSSFEFCGSPGLALTGR